MALRLKATLFRLPIFSRQLTRNVSCTTPTFNVPAPEQQSAKQNTIGIPQPDGADKVYSPKLEQIFQSISQLNLLEVAELSDLLKKRLNLPDAPVMNFSALPAGGAVSEEKKEDEESKGSTQTSFTIKLMSFDEKQKIALIKELKNLMPDMNLVQAKKFIESAPTVIKSDIGKDEAEKLKETLSKVGAVVVVS